MAARPLRIVHISPAYAPFVGGAERHLQAVSERLAARGHEVTVFTANGSNQREVTGPVGGSLPSRQVIGGVTVRRFPPSEWMNRAFRLWLELPGAWRTTSLVLGPRSSIYRRRPTHVGMLRALRRSDVDIVATMHWSFPPAWAGHVARSEGRFALVGVPLLHVGRPWAENLLFPTMLARCDAVIVNTSVEEEFVTARGARHVTVGGVGIDPGHFNHPEGSIIRARLGLGRSPVVGFIGRQVPLKGTLTLIEAMRQVWSAVPSARLLLGGQSAHRAPAVDELLATLPPELRTRVLQLDDFPDVDLPHIIDACDIVVLPSVEEGFGIVFLEGWMCGKPVIGARIPATACVIDEGVDGLLVEPLDAEDLARAILALLGDDALRARLGAAGRAKTLAHHTWDAVTDRWEATFQSAVARRS